MNSTTEDFLKIFNSIDFKRIKDHPNILIAANFWEEDRFHAAKIFYRYMRAIDDMIDHRKSKKIKLTAQERNALTQNVEKWLKMVDFSNKNNPAENELPYIIDTFRIPLRPVTEFANSMLYDICNDGFPTVGAFIEYARGASVAPAFVFVHLNSLRKQGGVYELPLFDAWEAATPCALFSYFVHVIRDFQKDQLDNLNYFADNLITGYNLTRKKLRGIAEGDPITDNFRMLIGDYYALADVFRLQTHTILQEILPLLEPRYQLSLQIIFDLYLMVFERIDLENGSFTASELNPTPEETRDRVFQKIINFNDSKVMISATS